MPHDHRLFRPPAEGDSLIIRVADGCPSNQCTFCGMYKGVPYHAHAADDIRRALRTARTDWPDAGRVFLADGDVMAFGFAELRGILVELNELFPRLARVSVYANGSSIAAKTDDQLRELRDLKLHTLYMGLESGDEEILRRVRKRETAAAMCTAAVRATTCGLRMSVMILIGLGGQERTDDHARETARVLNDMQPRLLSALRFIPVPNTELYQEIMAGRFDLLTEREAVSELRALVANLQLSGTVFRANHRSNVVPLEARFPRDRERLVAELDGLLASGMLDAETPGPMPLFL